MQAADVTRFLIRTSKHFGVIYAVLCVLMFLVQRSLLYFPSHDRPSGKLKPWSEDGNVIGYCREVAEPRTVWLMMHGNAGQASERDYALERMGDDDALYVLEYPGYGDRTGKPCRAAFDRAASEAYGMLCRKYPAASLGVIGESIGSGPASMLAKEKRRPDKIVLIVPFDSLYGVASKRFYFLPVWFLLLDRWDNVHALQGYEHEIDIFAARNDEVIPYIHAKRLADSCRRANFREIAGGHNEWSYCEEVVIER